MRKFNKEGKQQGLVNLKGSTLKTNFSNRNSDSDTDIKTLKITLLILIDLSFFVVTNAYTRK